MNGKGYFNFFERARPFSLFKKKAHFNIHIKSNRPEG